MPNASFPQTHTMFSIKFLGESISIETEVTDFMNKITIFRIDYKINLYSSPSYHHICLLHGLRRGHALLDLVSHKHLVVLQNLHALLSFLTITMSIYLHQDTVSTSLALIWLAQYSILLE